MMNKASERHRYDYFYRPGMEPRPAPPVFDTVSAEELGSYRPMRHRLTPPWRIPTDEPAQTPLTRLLDDHRWQGDELMDAVVAMFQRVGVTTGRAMLDRALDDGIDALEDAPKELVALFAQLDRIPDWYDLEAFERGRRVWVRSSTFGKLGEFTADIVSTAMTYEVGAAAGATGRFRRDPIRRNLETVTFFHDVTRQGSMDRFSATFKQTVRVRLMHAQVRRGLRKAWGENHYALVGDPISNAAMAQGVAAFGAFPMLLDNSLGRPCSREDMDAAAMYWGYIVYVFGVCEEIIPRNADESFDLGDHMLCSGAKRSQWSQELSVSFVDYFDDLVDSQHWLGRTVGRNVALPGLYGFLTHILGEPLMREFVAGTNYENSPLTRWAFAAGAVARANALSARALDSTPFIGQVRDRWVPQVDPFFVQGLRLLRAYSKKRAGLTETPYTSHDQTSATEMAKPTAPLTMTGNR